MSARHLLVLMLVIGLLLASHSGYARLKSYPYQGCFEVAAQLHKVPVDLLLAVAATESNWQADARSHANAHGIMQIQWPGTARHLGVKRVAELYNPCLNISLGAQYLAELLTTFKHDTTRALAAYNYGPTRIMQADTLPDGAKRYAGKVQTQRKKIAAGAVPERLRAAQSKTLTTFDSRLRAKRIADHLTAKLTGATVEVARAGPGRRYQVVLNIGAAGLTPGDHMLLDTLGLSL